MSHKPPSIKQEIRRETIIPLYIRGLSVKDIASKLKVSRSTVIRDINEVKNNIMSNFNQDPAEYVLSESLLQLQEVTKESWKTYNNCKNESNKVGSMNLIVKTVNSLVSILEKFGIEYDMVGNAKIPRSRNRSEMEDFLEEVADYARKKRN